MISAGDIWAVLPIKEMEFAKQRLAQLFSQDFRRKLALTMFEEVMRAVAGVSELSGIAVVTLDPTAADIAVRFGAQIWTDGARDGHTGAVTAAARRLAAARTNIHLRQMQQTRKLKRLSESRRESIRQSCKARSAATRKIRCAGCWMTEASLTKYVVRGLSESIIEL